MHISCSNNTIVNNKIDQSGISSSGYGIHIATVDCPDNKILNNTIIDCDDAVIHTWSYDKLIKDNKISMDESSHGIYSAGANNLLISGNEIQHGGIVFAALSSTA